jgi:ribosome biogenesis GTPase A
MAKTRKLLAENLSFVDIVIEMLDARIPISSQNPELARIIGSKPCLTVLSKSALADSNACGAWREYYKNNGRSCLFIDCIKGMNMDNIAPAIRELMSDKLEKYESKGMAGRALKAMIVGIPNVGKSSLINKLCGGRKAKVEDRPGVTRDKQWVKTTLGIDLLDTPGILWPKFDDKAVGEALAVTGAIKDSITDYEYIASVLCGKLRKLYPELLAERYKLAELPQPDDTRSAAEVNYEILTEIGRKRGFIVAGGEVNTERTAVMLLDEFRSGKIGRITLEFPVSPKLSPKRETPRNE